MNQFSHLLSPLTIGQAEVRNRVLVSAHVPGFADNNKAGKDYIAYHQTYARNGVGLQITGGTPVHHSGMLSVSKDGLWNLDDDIIPGYQNLSQAVHNEGGHILAQLAHSAGTVLINQIERASWSASAIRSETNGNISHAMTRDEINEVIASFASAASRVRQGGLDGVEILAAFGFLPQAFLSPLTNFRTDEYGGSLENRLRFTLELLAAVRAALGNKLILGIRIPGDEYEPGGLTLDDMKVVAGKLVATGSIDYLNVIAHTNFTHTGRSRHWPPTPAKHGLFIPLAATIKSVVDIPVFGIGRVTSPVHANDIIASGQADMIGMTRANICDPELVKKLLRNQTSRIRPCVGANTCIANRYAGKPVNCMHNAAVSKPGNERTLAKLPRKIAVIGAGPAGLECARIAAERGHNVTLYEALSKAGGQLNLWASVASMSEFNAIIDWRLNELEILGVNIQYNQHIDSKELTLLDVDVIVHAIGSSSATRKFPGVSDIAMLSPHQLLSANEVKFSNALVINEGRGQAALVAAECLISHGVKVEIVTSDIAVGNDLDPTVRNGWYTRLGELLCQFSSALKPISVDGNKVQLQNIFDQRIQYRDNVDVIIDWNGTRVNSFPQSITVTPKESHETYSIGDCVTPRTLEIAIGEAYKLANSL
ncbi:MAG: 2,4-dienoyl-CoA reductase-like NADH-dependent reductase (Old Yellow Enzyme family) [Gammaproteobacteria bacterium]|jgi:2,4-dienoyl-CoA reductase-like NADH-dependent reductase (Old Yellow Enzyme family)